MKKKLQLFGTDGIRGVANQHPMTVEIATQVGRAIAYIFSKDNRRHSIVIGKDTRLSGYMLESALVSGICSMGVDVVLIGPLPTPGIAYITRSLRADAGIVISASHNPYEDNGIKIFQPEGMKLPEFMENEMEEFIFSGAIDHIRPTALNVGKAYRIDDALGRYVEFAKNSFPKGMTLEGLNIAVDCANGAAYKAAPYVMKELGANIHVINNNPNGVNINENCGSLYVDNVKEVVLDHHCDVGLAFDGDADRLIAVDDKGQEVDGDYIMAICAHNFFQSEDFSNKTLVTTVMSNYALDKSIEKAGGTIKRTSVGDRYVLEEMIRSGALFGGEQSGHIIFRNHTTTGDGLITALQLLRVIKQTGKPLSELRKVLNKYPQKLRNIHVKNKIPFDKIPAIKQVVEKVNKELEGKGRLLLRYSGTESIARVMVEAETEQKVQEKVDLVSNLIMEHLT